MKTDTSFGCCVKEIANLEPFYCTEKNVSDINTYNVTATFENWFIALFVTSLCLAVLYFLLIVGICTKNAQIVMASKLTCCPAIAGFVLTIIGACYRWSFWGLMCSGDLLENPDKKEYLANLYMFKSGFLM